MIHLVGKAYKANATKKLKKHRVLPNDMKNMVHETNQVRQQQQQQQQGHQPPTDHGGKQKDSSSFMDHITRGVRSVLSSASLSSLPKIIPSQSVASSDGGDDVAHALNEECFDEEFLPIDTEGGAFLDLCRHESPQSSDMDSPDFKNLPYRLQHRGHSRASSNDEQTEDVFRIDDTHIGSSFFENEIKLSQANGDQESPDRDESINYSDARLIRNESDLFNGEGSISMAQSMEDTGDTGSTNEGFIRKFSDGSLYVQGKSDDDKK